MRFAAQYRHHGIGEQKPDYWRTVDANDLTEAQQIANQYKRKGYHVVKLIEDIYRKGRD